MIQVSAGDAMTKDAPRDTRSRRRQASEARRQAVLDAALDVFVADGFAAARLDDIATRAGVAKGTIYLFFADKEDLFEQVVLGAVGPVLADLAETVDRAAAPIDILLGRLFGIFQREVLGTRRREVLRLIIAEGAKFPRIAEFYHREVVSKGLAMFSTMATRAYERGELSSDALARFPHLLFGPLLVSVVWRSLFEPFQSLDVDGLLSAHRDLLLAPRTPQDKKS